MTPAAAGIAHAADRLLHHATVVVTTGESCRMRDARNPPEHALKQRAGGDFHLAKTGDRKLAIDTADSPCCGHDRQRGRLRVRQGNQVRGLRLRGKLVVTT